MKRMQHHPRRHRAFSPVLVLACALLWAQALGLAHGIVHGPQLGSLDAVSSSATAPAVSEGGPRVEQGFWAQLLAGHQGESDCRVFEQLNHTDALPAVPLLALPALAPLPPLAAVAGGCFVRQVLPFQARGPPPTR